MESIKLFDTQRKIRQEILNEVLALGDQKNKKLLNSRNLTDKKKKRQDVDNDTRKRGKNPI
jgi:hypothetical protein